MVVQIGVAWLFGARFDLAIDQLRQGNFRAPSTHGDAQRAIHEYDNRHQEL